MERFLYRYGCAKFTPYRIILALDLLACSFSSSFFFFALFFFFFIFFFDIQFNGLLTGRSKGGLGLNMPQPGLTHEQPYYLPVCLVGALFLEENTTTSTFFTILQKSKSEEGSNENPITPYNQFSSCIVQPCLGMQTAQV